MKCKNHILKAAALPLALLFLAACGAEEAVTETSATSQPSQEEANAEVELEMLIPDRMFPLGDGTAAGYYYVDPGAADYLTGQIRYVDYENAIDIPLSSQINSDHSSEDDPAYLDSIIGDYRMFIRQDQLYFLRSGASYYVDSSDFGSLATGALYRMNLDGSERTLLYQGDGSGDLMMYAVGAENCLYLFQQTAETLEVLQIMDSSHEVNVIASLPLDAYYMVVGCADGKIYFHVMGYDENKLNEYGDAGLTHTLSALEVTTGALTDILDLYPDDYNYAAPYMAGQMLYLLYPNQPGRVDVCTTNGTVEKTISFADEMAGLTMSVTNPYIAGNTLVIPCWSDKKNQGANLLVHGDTGEAELSEVILTQEDGKDSLGAIIVAENEDSYLAITAIRYVDAKMPLGDGTSSTVQKQVYEYSLIPKSEFCNTAPSAQIISRVE